MPDGPYRYEIIYRGSGEVLPYAIATGLANVDSELHTNAKVVDLGSRLDTTVPQTQITGATLSGDEVSWNFGKVYGSTDSVRFIYTANSVERTVELTGNGPAFAARMAEVPLGDHLVPWRIEYRRAGEDYPYAKTSGTATLHITGTPINPTITEVDEYELPVAGNSPIDRPITLADGFLGWSTPTSSPTDVVKFFYNSTNEVTAVPNGTGWKVDLRTLPEATYTYRIEYRATANGTAYAVVTGTFTVGHPFGEVTGYGRTIDAPHAETVPTPSLSIETVLTPHPPEASWTQITPYAGHVAYIPVVNTAANGGGWMQTAPKSLEHPQGLFGLASGYSTSSDKQIVFGSGSSTDAITFEIAPASNPTAFSSASIYTVTGARLAVNINALSGAYRFRITYTRPGAPAAYAVFTGDVNATSNSLTFDPAVAAQGPQVAAPTLGQSFDRWGNLLASRDAAGNFTSFRYNQHNQEVRRIEASVETLETVPTITATAVSPEFRNFYDKLGNLIATRDAQGNESRFHYNQVGQLLWQQNADAGRYGNATMQYAYDAYGNVVRQTDQLGFETRTVYDHANRVTDIVREVDDGVFSDTDTRSVVVGQDFEYFVQRTKYVYDEAGRRVREVNGENEATRYSYDLTGNLLVRRTPLGYSMTYEYDINGRKSAEQDAVLTRSEWTYNYFGQLTDHIGKRSLAGTNAELYGSGGATDYDYHYNYAGLIDYQSTSAGMLVRYQYDEAGQLATVNDATIGRLTNYVYDTAGRHVRERVIIDGLVHQDTRTTYDSHNRISNLNDTDYRVNYSYDRNGNRTLIKATYRDQFGTSINQTLYYTYDEMNRVLVSQGTTFGSGDLMSVVATTAQGIELAYNARGDRASAKTKGDRWEFNAGGYAIAPGIMTSEYYNYDGLGRLVRIEKETELALNNKSDLRIYFYDHADRVIAQSDYYLDGSQKKARVTGTTYDDNGQVLQQSTSNNGVTESIVTYGNGNLASIIPIANGVNGWTAGYDAAGNLRGYDVSIRDPGDGHELYVNQYRNHYTLGESYLLNSQTVQADRSGNGIPLNGTTYRLYNQNEELTEFRDSSSEAQDQWRIFANNQAGQALTTINQDFGAAGSIKAAWEYAVSHSAGGSNLKVQHFFFADGNSVGSFGQLKADGSEGFTANFDVNYTPISSSYPSSVPQTLVAVAGDTPRTIAARIYGDGNLWYVIARENLFSSPDEAITEGTIVKLPNEVVSLANSSSVFKPFDPSLVLGDTTPTQPMPPPKQAGCGVIGMIIMIVVAVVLSVITAGAAAAALATAWGAVAGTVSIASVAAAAVGGAIGGIVGSIASQAVGIAIGAQEKFSWKAVAQGALSGAVGGALFGVGDVSGAFGAKTFTAFTESLGKAGPYVAAGLQSAASSAITQGLSVAVGLQDKFSWRQVAAAAVGGVAGQAVGNLVGPTLGKAFGEKGGELAKDTLAGFAGGVARTKVMGGKVDYVNIAADAFGNALGNAVGRAITNAHDAKVKEREKREERMTDSFLRHLNEKNPGFFDSFLPGFSFEPTAPAPFSLSESFPEYLPLPGSTGNESDSQSVGSSGDSEQLEEVVVTGTRANDGWEYHPPMFSRGIYNPGQNDARFQQVGSEGTHFYMVQLVGSRFLGAQGLGSYGIDRLNKISAYSQWADENRLTDAFTYGALRTGEKIVDFFTGIYGGHDSDSWVERNDRGAEPRIRAVLDSQVSVRRRDCRPRDAPDG